MIEANRFRNDQNRLIAQSVMMLMMMMMMMMNE